jgi:hypothetical protein
MSRGKSYAERAEELIRFYESRRVCNHRRRPFEPLWTVAPFTCLYRWKAGERVAEDIEAMEQAVETLSLFGRYEDFHGVSFIEDGFKVGTASWVFMGRGLPDTTFIPWTEDLVIVGRTPSESTINAMAEPGRLLPPVTVWIAYSITMPLHVWGIGPCECFAEVEWFISHGNI